MGLKVKTFFYVFFKSIIPRAFYYQKIKITHFAFSAKYFSALILMLSFLFVLFTLYQYPYNKFKSFISGVESGLKNYPDSLTLNFQNGTLFTNLNKPHFFWWESPDRTRLLMVIDQSALPDKIKQYKSYALLTAREAVINFSGTITTVPFTSIKNTIITKNNINDIIPQVQFIQKTLFLFYIGFIIALFILVPLLSFITTLFYLVIICSLIFVVFKFILKKNVHYKKILQLSFHAVTLPLILDYSLMIYRPSMNIGNLFNISFKPIPLPLVFFIMLVIYAFVGVYEAYYQNRISTEKHHHVRHKDHHKTS